MDAKNKNKKEELFLRRWLLITFPTKAIGVDPKDIINGLLSLLPTGNWLQLFASNSTSTGQSLSHSTVDDAPKKHGNACNKKKSPLIERRSVVCVWQYTTTTTKSWAVVWKDLRFFDLRFFHHHHRVPTTILFSIVAFANCVRLGKQRDHNDEISLLTSTNLVLPALMSTYFWQHRCHLLRLTKFFVGLRMLIVAKGFRVSHSYIYSIEQQPFFHQNPTKTKIIPDHPIHQKMTGYL